MIASVAESLEFGDLPQVRLGPHARARARAIETGAGQCTMRACACTRGSAGACARTRPPGVTGANETRACTHAPHSQRARALSQVINETLPALHELKRRGLVRHIGITGYPL